MGLLPLAFVLLFLFSGCDAFQPDLKKNEDFVELDDKVDRIEATTKAELTDLRTDVDGIKVRVGMTEPGLAPLASGSGQMQSSPQVRMMYKQARAQFTGRDYENAAEAFRRILDLAPDDKLAPNARYWLGECFYSRSRYNEAITEFQQVVRDYPASDKAPDAALKIAYSYHRLDNGPLAMEAMRNLLRQWPGSHSAKMVRSGKTLFKYP